MRPLSHALPSASLPLLLPLLLLLFLLLFLLLLFLLSRGLPTSGKKPTARAWVQRAPP